MKNGYSLILVIVIVLVTVVGCSSLNPFSAAEPSNTGTPNDKNKTLTDRAVDTTVGESRIGVPECDQVMDDITREMNNPDDNFVTKAVKATILNRIKDGIRESVEKNKQDKVELVKTCREFKAQFDKYKEEEEAKKKEK